MFEALCCFLFVAIAYIIFFPKRMGKEMAKVYSDFMEGWNSYDR